MADNKEKFLMYAGLAVAGFAALFGGLYIKNKMLFKPLPKEQVIAIIKDIRKQLQVGLQQIIGLYEQIKMQVTPQQFKEEVVQSEQGMNFKVQLREIVDKVAKEHGTDGVTYEKSITHYDNNHDPQIKRFISVLERDYKLALQGATNSELFDPLPEIPLDKLFEIFKQVTQAQYIQTAENIRLMVGKTEQQVMSDPETVAKLQKFQAVQKEKMLRNNGITGGSDSPVMVYNLLIKQAEKRDPDFKVKVKNIESSYQLIIQKHLAAFQRSQDPEVLNQVLNQLDDQLIYKGV